MKILTIHLGDRKFGIPIGLIREILVNFDITIVDRSSADIAGLMNVRGQIVTVISPAVTLGGEHESEPGQGRAIVFKKNGELGPDTDNTMKQCQTSNDLYAFHVDNVSDVHDIGNEGFIPVPGNTKKEEAEFLTCVARVDGDVLPVLDVKKLIAEEEPLAV